MRGHTVMGEAANFDSATVVDTFEPDAVVVELNGESPVKVISTLRLTSPRRVVFVASHNSTTAARIAATQAGADGVFVEPFDIDELVACLETMMSWGIRRQSVLRLHDLEIDEGAHTVTRGSVGVALTVTEFKLLVVLVLNVGLVMSKRNLLVLVWGFGDYDPNVVEVHVSALRKKLETTGAPMIETVRGVGYVIRKTHQQRLPLSDKETRVAPVGPRPIHAPTPTQIYPCSLRGDFL